MVFSDFALRIILLFIPGIIALLIIDRLTSHRSLKVFQWVIYSLLLGFSSYVFYYLIILFLGKLCPSNEYTFSFFRALTDKDITLEFGEIILVTGLSIIIGFIFVYLINYTVLHRIAQKIKASKKFGDYDVWGYLMNSDQIYKVIVRDRENDLMYYGRIKAFSDACIKDELFLKDVRVYRNSDAEMLYKMPGIYISKKRENLILEFPEFDFKNKKFKDKANKDEEG